MAIFGTTASLKIAKIDFTYDMSGMKKYVVSSM